MPIVLIVTVLVLIVVVVAIVLLVLKKRGTRTYNPQKAEIDHGFKLQKLKGNNPKEELIIVGKHLP